ANTVFASSEVKFNQPGKGPDDPFFCSTSGSPPPSPPPPSPPESFKALLQGILRRRVEE
ncbi:hypothetical protein A2U01_0118569, partial [Trifolium medium]|nr:hypothetical protein [Trifolium medium]